MKLTWLGQAGIMLETDGKIILIDPYLSNSCQKLNPASYRRVPVDESFLKLTPDVIVCTHHHQDHYDEDTLDHYLKGENGVTVIVAPSCFSDVRKYGFKHNYVYFPPKTQWTEGNVRFSAVKAVHSDPEAIGIIIEAEGKKLYFTGDTLYNDEIFEQIPDGIDALFVVVNGVGTNMNMTDARRFSQRVAPKKTVPLHMGMLDDNSLASFTCDNAVIPEIYKEIVL